MSVQSFTLRQMLAYRKGMEAVHEGLSRFEARKLYQYLFGSIATETAFWAGYYH